MAKVTVYDNSKFATFLSFLGYMGIVLGVYSLFEEELGFKVGIIALVIGFVLKMLANFINNNKIKKIAKQKND